MAVEPSTKSPPDYSARTEYRQQHAGDAALVAALYQDILGRAADAEGRAQFVGQLAAGASAEDIAARLLQSTERIRRVAESTYGQVLRRAPSAGELASASERISAGSLDAAGLAAELFGSNEYAVLPWL